LKLKEKKGKKDSIKKWKMKFNKKKKQGKEKEKASEISRPTSLSNFGLKLTRVEVTQTWPNWLGRLKKKPEQPVKNVIWI